jgi:hypothetical protein
MTEPGYPTVQLLHSLPDGSSHVDWMLGQDRRGQRPLVTFRLSTRVDTLRSGVSVAAERLAEHRPRYLSYEGPVASTTGQPPDPAGRGVVWRLNRGRILAWRREPDAWWVEIEWECPSGAARRQLLHLTPRSTGVWSIRRG